MDFYYLQNNNHKLLYSNKNNKLFPNQLYNHNYCSDSAVSTSPIKPQNFFKSEKEDDSFYNFRKNNNCSNINLMLGYKIYGNDNILSSDNYKKNFEDIDNKSVNFNNTKRSENIKLKNSHSYSNIVLDNKNYKESKALNNYFDYSNKKINEPIYNTNKKDFYSYNQKNNINKDNYWMNGSNNTNFQIKDKSYSFFENKNNNKNERNPSNNLYLNNNYILTKDNNKKNNKSLSSSKIQNDKKYNYLFDYSEKKNNLNNELINNFNNNFNLHDKYISPDYIDVLKSKNFYSSNKGEKSQFFFKSLNKFESCMTNYKSKTTQQTSNSKYANKSDNTNSISNKMDYNNNLNKSNENYKDNLLNYILNNSEIFRKIIDNNLSNQNNKNNNKSNLQKNVPINYYLPKKLNSHINKKTLLLDLDETLVHSSFKPLQENPDINFNIYFQNKPHTINVLIRPYVQEFLKAMSNFYEIVIFTASVPQYANPLLDILDKNKYISHRLYRQHCISLFGLFIKDLRKIGRDLKNTIILDNNPISYLLNQDNGIPIKSWHSDKNDQELLKLIPLMEYLSKNEISDVREIIKKIVVNNSIDFNFVNSIINKTNFIDKNKNNLKRANSFSSFNQNNIVENKKFITPKKDKKILINNYFKNESYDKKDNKNNININIINFNIGKVIMKENSSNNSKINFDKKIKNIPIYNKSKTSNNKSKIDMLKNINNINTSKSKISKENIEALINSKYKYLTHLINGKKQYKSNKLINKEIEINKSLLNYKRHLSQKNILSTSNKNRNSEKKNFSIQKDFNNSQNKKDNKKDYNDLINKYQIHQNLKSLYDSKNKEIETSNNINSSNINYLYNNFINSDKNKNNIFINKKFNYYSILNDINSNVRNDEKIIFNKIHQRASTPSAKRLFFPSNFGNLYKEYNNYDNTGYVYKYN